MIGFSLAPLHDVALLSAFARGCSRDLRRLSVWAFPRHRGGRLPKLDELCALGLTAQGGTVSIPTVGKRQAVPPSPRVTRLERPGTRPAIDPPRRRVRSIAPSRGPLPPECPECRAPLADHVAVHDQYQIPLPSPMRSPCLPLCSESGTCPRLGSNSPNPGLKSSFYLICLFAPCTLIRQSLNACWRAPPR